MWFECFSPSKSSGESKNGFPHPLRGVWFADSHFLTPALKPRSHSSRCACGPVNFLCSRTCVNQGEVSSRIFLPELFPSSADWAFRFRQVWRVVMWQSFGDSGTQKCKQLPFLILDITQRVVQWCGPVIGTCLCSSFSSKIGIFSLL